MSLILEALRKSEAERRRGVPVDPFAVPAPPPPTASPPRPRRPRWPLAIAAFAVLAVTAAVAWWSLRDRVDPDAVTTAVDTATGAASPAAAPPDLEPRDDAAFPAIERIAPPAQDPTGDLRAPAPIEPPTTATAARDDRGADPTAPSPVPAPPSRAIPPADATPAATPPTAPPPPSRPAPAADAAAGAPIRLSELPPAQRERLPPLRLSMHMWNAEPSRRFVILDGHRQVEGDRVGAGTVHAIEADGVIIDLDGQRLRLPIR